MRIRTFLGIFSVLLSTSPVWAAEPAAVPDAAQITERWRAYFQVLQGLSSWSYNAQMRLSESDPKQSSGALRVVSDIQIRLANLRPAKAAPLFYREMQVRSSDKAPYQVVVLAYNGKKYQMAVQNPQPTLIEGHQARKLMLLGSKPFADDPTLKTNFHLPLAMPFIFVAEDITEVPFANLQKAEQWADVQKRITGIAPGQWEGRSGFLVSIAAKQTPPPSDAPKKDEVEKRVEVFVDEVSGLPLHLTNIDVKTQAVVGEIKITQLRLGENGLPAFPLRVEIIGNATGERETSGNGLIEVEPASVVMNAPIDAARFTIPLTSMEYVIENDKVVYSSFPKTAPKKPLKTPIKTPAKPAAKKPVKRR